MNIKLNCQRLLLACAVPWVAAVPLLAQTVPATPPNFGPLRPVIASLRSKSDADLSIKFDETTFTVQQVNRSPITAEAGSSLEKADTIQGIPEFRVDEGKFFIVRHVTESTWVEQELTERTSGAQWNKKTLDPVATYPLDDWTGFVDYALSEGLVQYGSFSTEQKTFGYLLFASKGQPSLDYNGGTLQLSGNFYRSMRLASKFPPVAGKAGFVILVHDPHADVAGRFTLLRGLDSLFQGNVGTNFCFLDEGEFPGTNPPTLSARLISDGGLHSRLQTLTPESRLSAIYQLLGSFRMDTPRAYQEIYFKPHEPETRIKSYKIDDVRYLHEPLIDRVSDDKFESALQVILDAARRALSKAEGTRLTESSRRPLMVAEQVFITSAMERADVDKMSDEESIDFYNLLSEELESLLRSASAAFPQSPKVSSALAVLQTKVREHSLDAKTFASAIERNKTMSRLIVTAAKAPATYGGIPIAFIGSFHTNGITTELRDNNIGYIVIEPVRSTIFPAPEKEEKDFARFVAQRNAFLRAPGVNKGAAELTPTEVQAYVIPKLQHAAQWHDLQVAAIAAKVAHSSTIDPGKLSSSILNNPYSIYTSVDVGGGGSVPPDMPRGGFAFFEPSSDGLRLNVLGTQDERWKSDDSRYRFLALVTARIPERDASNPNAHWIEAMKLNFQDRASGQDFVSYYDGARNRLWLVETSMASVSSLISRPVKRGARTVEFGMTTAELNTNDTKVGDDDADNSSGSGSKN